MEKGESTAVQMVGHLIGDVIGWVFCLSWLGGSYLVGFVVAGYLGLAEHAQSIGILSAMVAIWSYEHRRADERWERFLKR